MLNRPSLGAILLGLIILGGGLLRLAPIFGSGFPLNDGGLFLTMADDLRANGFAIPDTTTYNGLGIPYAYPPLGFYLTGGLQAVGFGGLDVLRIVPALASIATIPVVYLIGREVFHADVMAAGAAAFFAVSTGSYEWQILGGGITRAPGFLLALVAILLAIQAYRGGSRWLSIGSGLALGATGLWHPQAAVFGVLSVVLLLPFTATDRRRALRHLGVLALTAAALTAPWLVMTLSRHGADVFTSAAATGGTPFAGLVTLLTSRTSAGQLEVLGIATTLGLLVSGLRGFWLAPAWMIAIVIIDSRAGQPYVAVPAALAVTFMLRDLGSAIGRMMGQGGDTATRARWASAVIGAVLLAAAAADSLAAQGTSDSPLRPLPEATRAAMTWVAEETDPGATFVVVSGRYWALDAESEWFPVLADRRNLATVQGHEWLEDFEQQRERASTLPQCVATEDLACIEQWIEQAGDVDYLFLTVNLVAETAGLECCHQLADQIGTIHDTDVVYRSAAVIIVRLNHEETG